MTELNRFIRTKDFFQQTKYRLYAFLTRAITNSFSQNVVNISNSSYIKFYVDNSGNNNQLVKAIMKKRTWFQFVEQINKGTIEGVQVIWTQWKK